MRGSWMVVLAGCSSRLADASFPTGSSTIVAQGDSIVTIDADSGVVVRLDAGDGEVVASLDVGGEPSRVAPIGDTGRFAVTLRAARTLAVVEAGESGLSLVTSVTVGAEPVGVVSDEGGHRVYVAVSAEDRVVELDGGTLEVVRTFDVPGQPRWLALQPGSDALYAMSAYGGASVISLHTGAVTSLPLPNIDSHNADRVTIPLTSRITGDPAVTPDGEWLLVPALYFDNLSREFSTSQGYYAPQGDPRWNPVVVTQRLAASGEPQPGFSDAISLAATIVGDPGQLRALRVASYPTSVTIDPDTYAAYVTMEGMDAIVAVIGGTDGRDRRAIEVEPLAVISTGTGPNGVAIRGARGWTLAALDHAVQELDLAESRGDLSGAAEGAARVSLPDATFDVAEPTFSADIERGRRLFFGADNPVMSASGAGVSCATCHFEGRNDGMTWPLASGDRQTPSLAGRVSDTLPLTWTDEVQTVAHEVALTSAGRMGGTGLDTGEAEAVAAYIDTIRAPDVPVSDPAAVARGAVLFERADVGCSGCHSGPAFTDGAGHAMFRLDEVDTPALRGVALTAPYAHDGRFATLEELLLAGEMGGAAALTPAERADLIAYVRSL